MNNQVVEQIKERLDVVDVIGGYIQLRKAGANYKAVCPFHHEKSGSFMVSQSKQIWHCFGCGLGGDIFGFVMRQENLEFRDALTLLAERAGIALVSLNQEQIKEKQTIDTLYKINGFAAEYYHRSISVQRGMRGKEYLQKRKLTEATIREWKIGYAPEAFHYLEEALLVKGITKDQLVAAGVSSRSEKGVVYDKFRDRITFPIFDIQGRVIGFSARTLSASPDTPKYLNTPETQIYHKSKVLFGLYQAKNAIRQLDSVIVVEGQMDVISLHQSGFKNVVATSGTALTLDQLRSLKRLTSNIILCFDSDAAGQAALYRAGILALQLGLKTKTIVLKGGKDPDEIVSTDPSVWSNLVTSAVWFPDYCVTHVRQSFPFNSLEQKQALVKDVAPVVRSLVDDLEKEHYIRKIAEDFNLSVQSVTGMLAEKKTYTADSGSGVHPELNQNATQAKDNEAEKFVLGGLLYSPRLWKEIQKILTWDDFETSEIRELLIAYDNTGRKEDPLTRNNLVKEAEFMVESYREMLKFDDEKLLTHMQKCSYNVLLHSLKRQLDIVHSKIKSLETQSDQVETQGLYQQFTEIVKRRGEVERQLATLP